MSVLERYGDRLRLGITDCDREIERQLSRIESKIDPVQHPLVRTKEVRRKPRGNEARFDLRNDLYRIFGVDLTDVPGGE